MSQNQKPISRRRFLKMTSMTVAGLYLTTGCSSEPNIQEPDFSTLTFGLTADVHYCDYEPAGIRHYRQSIQKLSECVDDLNNRDLPFVIHLGDVINRDIESFAAILPLFNRFRPPLYHVLGNHDYGIEDAYKETVHELLGLTSKYYDFVKGPPGVLLFWTAMI